MNKENETRRLWAWHLSALFYEWAYIRVAHQTDDDIFTYLGSHITGATVVDCGCGPGVVTEKFLQAGAAKVIAIDANAGMLGKTKTRLHKAIAEGRVLLQQASHEGQTLARLCQQEPGRKGFDVILFKRSLYMPRSRALETLRCAASTLSKKGLIIVVHPEQSLSRYAFSPPFGLTPYTLFHVGNRVASRVAEWCGMEEYNLYSRHELLALLQESVPDAKIELIPSQQRPYNIVALQAP